MSDDRFYVATIDETEAQEAVKQWLTTGMMRVAESSISFNGSQLVYLPFAQFHSALSVRWEGNIGRLDSAAYKQAENAYNVQVARVAHLPSSERPWLNMPAKRDFVEWRHQWDTVETEWWSPLHMTAAGHQFDERIEDWANTMLDKLELPASGSYATLEAWSQHGDANAFLQPLSDLDMTARFSGALEKAVKKAVSKDVGGYEYSANIDANPTYNHTITTQLIVPVNLVQYTVDGKQGLCIVDGLAASTVIGAKVRDIKGMFGRIFGKMFGDPKPKAAATPAAAQAARVVTPAVKAAASPSNDITWQQIIMAVAASCGVLVLSAFYYGVHSAKFHEHIIMVPLILGILLVVGFVRLHYQRKQSRPTARIEPSFVKQADVPVMHFEQARQGE